jgi:hypothetical protein
MPKVDLKQIVSLLENTDPKRGFDYDDAWDTHREWSVSDRPHLAELASLLNHSSLSVVAYALKSIRRIGGNLDEYLETICGCMRPTTTRGFCGSIEAAGINSEIAAIVRASLLNGSSVARKYGERLVEDKAVSWFDRLRIRWLIRRSNGGQVT